MKEAPDAGALLQPGSAVHQEWYKPTMNVRKCFYSAAAIALAFGQPIACAQPHDAKAIELDARKAIDMTSKAFHALHQALGMPAEAAKDANNSACAEDKKCSLATAIDATQASGFQIREEVAGRKRDDTALGGDFGNAAAAGLLPAVEALPLWDRAARGTQQLELNSAQARKDAALIKLAPKLAAARDDTRATLQAAVDYLKFSGVPTQRLETALPALGN